MKAGHPLFWTVSFELRQPERRLRMKLVELLTDTAKLDARAAAIDVRGVTADSRAVKPGDVFVAMAGSKTDGLAFAAQAAAAGAAAIIGEKAPPSLPTGAVFAPVANARRALALAAARFYGRNRKRSLR